MSRGLNPSAIAILENGGGGLAALVKMDFNTPITITDVQFPLPFDGETYSPAGTLLKVGDVIESSEIRINPWSFVLSGTDQNWWSLILSSDIIDTPVSYHLAVFDDAYQVVDTVECFAGTITGSKFNENNSQSRITITCASHWADFQKRPGRMSHPASHEQFSPGDGAFFEYASEPLTDRRWTIKENNG